MHITSRKALTNFAASHPEADAPLDRWYRVARRADWANFAEIRADLPSADRVGHLVIFDIGGNKYRLIAAIHHRRRKLFVRNILTHRECDQGGWQE